MNHVVTSALLMSLAACAAACGLTNRPQAMGKADAAELTVSSSSPALLSRKPPSSMRRTSSAARSDAERLRAANAMAVLHVGLAGLSLPSRD